MGSASVSVKASSLEKNKKKEEARTYTTRRPGWFGFWSRGSQVKAGPSGSSPGHGGNNIDVPPPPEHGWNNIQTESGDEGPTPTIGDIIIPRI